MKSRLRERLLCSGSFLLAWLVPGAASPQEAPGFALDRFAPAERGSDWFVLDSLDLRGHLRHAIGDVTEVAYKPLVMYNTDHSERAAVIRLQAVSHLGGSLVLWDRVRLGINVPVSLGQWGESGRIGDVSYSAASRSTMGDIRIGTDVRLVGKYRDPFTIAAGLQLFVPTGDQNSYTGDGVVRALPRMQVAGDFRDLAFSGSVAFHYRSQDRSFAGIPVANAVEFGAAAGIRSLHSTLLIGPEIFGATGVSSSAAFFGKQTTPLEALFGAHYSLSRDLRVDLGLGPGLSKGFGTPLWRAMASIEWRPEIAPSAPSVPADRDHDSIADSFDACPGVPGVWAADPTRPGCPALPPDRDRDGIIDAEDACLDWRGVATQDATTNGCTPFGLDRDRDGVVDREDACPERAGVGTQDAATNGCPLAPADTDRDGIVDPDDACPRDPGPPDSDARKRGCPIALVDRGQIRLIQPVVFAGNKSMLTLDTELVLDAVLDLLQRHPEFTHVRVQYHFLTGQADAGSQALALARTKAVVDWLVKQGIDTRRLQPAAPASDDTGETINGIAFHVLQGR